MKYASVSILISIHDTLTENNPKRSETQNEHARAADVTMVRAKEFKF